MLNPFVGGAGGGGGGGGKRVGRTFNLSLRGKSLIEDEVRQLWFDTASSWIVRNFWRNIPRSI